MLQDHGITRRALAGLAITLSGVTANNAEARETGELVDIERQAGGELGVYALQVGKNRALAWRQDERFLMCSTFKLLASAATLARTDGGDDILDRRIAYSASDLVEPNPVTAAAIAVGSLPLGALCEAAVKESDSTAANLLMRTLGGPPALTRFMRSLGDEVTRVDRYELAANTSHGDMDTTSPRAMAHSVMKLILSNRLKRASSESLEHWMRADQRGANRLRAGVPSDWVCGSKPGTSPTATNDVAVLRPPRGGPLIVAAYYRSTPAELGRRESVLKLVGQAVTRWAARS